MSLNATETAKILKKFQSKPGDTGSSEVQIAILSEKISRLTQHFATHKHDHHSRQGLLRMVSNRRSLLNYLKKVDLDRYRKLISALELRG